MFTFKYSTFYTIIQWNYYKHVSHLYLKDLLWKIDSEIDSLLATQFSSKNWFAAGPTVQQWKLVHYRLQTSVAKIGSLPAAQFGSENCFVAGTSILEANATSLQPTRFWQWMLIRCRQLDFESESRLRCRQHTFGSKCYFTADNKIRHQTPDSLRTTQFGSEHLICYGQHHVAVNTLFATNNSNSAANTTQIQQRTPDSLRTTWIRQWTPDSLRTT